MSAYKDQPGSDYAREVADAIIDQLRKGTAPWTKPWEAGQSPITPHYPSTGKEYRGANAGWLMVEGQRRGYEDTRWMTFRQANEHGGAVRRGEKGTRIQYWLWSGEEPVIDKETGKAKTDEKGELVRERVQYQRPRIFTAVVFRPRTLRPKPASRPSVPPRWTWKPSTWFPASSVTSWPLSPMSATWMRAHELGQPLMLSVTGTSISLMMSAS